MATLVDSYAVSNYSADYYYSDSGSLSGQSFTGNGGILSAAKFYLKKNAGGSPVGNMRVEIYAHTGTFGSTGVPTGSPLAVSENVAAASLGTSYALVNFQFLGANRITLTNGTKYFVVYTSSDYFGDYPHKVLVGFDSSSPSHGGNRAYSSGGAWTAQDTLDIIFEVYTDVAGDPANSERSAKITGKSTSNSERAAKVTGKTTANSERAAKLTGVLDNTFSREVKGSLPTTDLNLAPVYSAGEITDVSTDNDVYVDLEAIAAGYAIHQYKVLNTNNTDKINITFKGRSSIAPTASSVRLQVYNRNSAAWETLDTESAASANTKFTMTGSVTTNLSYYYDANFIVSIRVYQQVT